MSEHLESLPGVSIYIIAHLATEERGLLLKSICENALEQRYPEFEVVVSDNAGPVRVEDALKSIDDPRLKIFRNEENLGFGGNFNECLNRCAYDIIKLNCDDDLLHPDFLALTVPLLDDESFVVCDCEKYVIGNDPAELRTPIKQIEKYTVREPGYGGDIWYADYLSLPGCCLFTRELFRSLGGYNPGSVLPDWDLMIEAHLRRKVVHVHETLCWMGVWRDSITVRALKERPYFFQQGWLFTKYRVLHHDVMSGKDRAHLRLLLIGEFLWQSIRAVYHIFQKGYRSGYVGFVRENRRLISGGRELFK